MLLGNGIGGYKPLPPNETGLMANADARALGKVKDAQGSTVIFIGNNNGALQVYRH